MARSPVRHRLEGVVPMGYGSSNLDDGERVRGDLVQREAGGPAIYPALAQTRWPVNLDD